MSVCHILAGFRKGGIPETEVSCRFYSDDMERSSFARGAQRWGHPVDVENANGEPLVKKIGWRSAHGRTLLCLPSETTTINEFQRRTKLCQRRCTWTGLIHLRKMIPQVAPPYPRSLKCRASGRSRIFSKATQELLICFLSYFKTLSMPSKRASG